MIIYKLSFSIIAIICFLLSIKKKAYPILVGGLFLSMFTALITNDTTSRGGLIVFTVITSIGIWIVLRSLMETRQKLLLSFIGIYSMCSMLSLLEGWSHYSEIQIGVVFPLMVFIYLLFKGFYQNHFFYFALLLISELVIRFFDHWL